MCSTIIWTLVLQTTVCVAPRARRRSVPSRSLSDTLAASAARSRPESRHEPDLSEFEPPRPPRSTSDMLQEHRRQHISTTKVVASVVGCAMHMKWPDGIGRGMGLGEPKTGKRELNSGIARADRPCYWVSPCGWKREGPPAINVVVVVVVVVVEH